VQWHPHLLAVDDVDRELLPRVIRTRQVLSSAVPWLGAASPAMTAVGVSMVRSMVSVMTRMTLLSK